MARGEGEGHSFAALGAQSDSESVLLGKHPQLQRLFLV
jgi:hypothetical protein